jgi:hypothetical protein
VNKRDPLQEERHLRALVDQAFELRDTPYLTDACAAIRDWHERRELAAFVEIEGKSRHWSPRWLGRRPAWKACDP